uniref:Alternative protein MYPN n=1 Tax=Homo sapiens TaxID=9606 RepID=L8EAK0_HUMAN|nr:alternative protein MYPN [Homo sapiens]
MNQMMKFNMMRSPRASVLLPSLTRDSSTSGSQKALQSHSPAKLLGYLFQRFTGSKMGSRFLREMSTAK